MGSMQYFLHEHTLLIIFATIAYFVIIGGLGAWLAERKGYSPGAWFIICFITGFIGIIVLAGAPSLSIETSLTEIKSKLKGISNEADSGSPAIVPLLPINTSNDTWHCKKCKTVNPVTGCTRVIPKRPSRLPSWARSGRRW